jgi:GxxExxY protein
MENHRPLSEREEQIATAVVDAAYTVHKAFGPGVQENIYETCFCYELGKRGFPVRRQVHVPLIYDGHKFDDAVRLDVLVEELVICELKAVEAIIPLHNAQLLTQLKLTKKRLGFLINFNVPVIKDGIKRIIL